MMFARISVNHTTGEVQAVATQETPFDRGGVVTVVGHNCETVDLGLVEDQPFIDLAGQPCPASGHLFYRLIREGIKASDIVARKTNPGKLVALARAMEVGKIHDLPCTNAGLRAHIQANGKGGMPMAVRAWLVNVLPQRIVDELQLEEGVPLAAVLAAEAVRCRRDPQRGSRLFALQQRADLDAKREQRLEDRANFDAKQKDDIDKSVAATKKQVPPAKEEPQ